MLPSIVETKRASSSILSKKVVGSTKSIVRKSLAATVPILYSIRSIFFVFVG